MQVTCPSCKFGGTVRDDQIPPDGKEVFCPSCNVKFRIKRNQSSSTTAQRITEKTTGPDIVKSEFLPISCPICGFNGKLKRNTAGGGQSKRFTCPSCKNPFTLTLPDIDSPPADGGESTDTTTGTPSLCTGCGSRITHTLPICPSCGKILTGIRIYCPSCKSTNVGIRDKAHNDGGAQGETIIFRPVSPTANRQTAIQIPLSCRDCGNTWMIQTTLIQTTDMSTRLPHGEE